MIDWTKPIETVDGRKARKLRTELRELWHLVYVPSDSTGDVFLVNAEGFRCDDRKPKYPHHNPQFIRNVKVKKEGWVLMVPPTKTSFVTFTGPMYETKEKALEALEDFLMKMDYHSTLSLQPGIKPVYLKWEE